ncbi:transcriptional regulator with XRE-family HTH domain [Catenuloplanes nepalensis]|uniref:Transcriptional regulator with XRE-family HTH domain n=1 Tax=Catenuloplanes nepalensis TaxID=587533 RepID=A0ABT9MV34_9ACTN|nr:helix-turn-helix transcriptional regulator [Catenuloplanes nepalensis]MDP9795093.1 transcriptional regulator with XRE-family HTH domain [Catenuloplanes nepalensis]
MSTRNRAEFGNYLRQRRTLLPPDRPSTRRRVPGLRRQEVAEAAGISVEYLTRLEQGRVPHPSREVLAALGRALELATGERDHMFRLAGEAPPGPPTPDSVVRPGLLRALRGLDDALPVTVHDGRLEMLARNAAATDLYGPIDGEGRYRHNIVHQGFTAGTRHVLGDAGAHEYTRWATAELRAALGRYPDDEHLRSLLAELTATSADFRSHWARGEAASARSGVKQVRHPARGWLAFQTELLHDPERDHWIVFYAPAA